MTHHFADEEFWVALESHIPTSGNYVSAQVAEQFVAHLREHDPALLDRWLNYNADRFVRELIGSKRIAVRSAAGRRVRAARFNDAVAAAEEGDTTQLEKIASDFWATGYVVLVDGQTTTKLFPKLNREDCLYLVEEHTGTVNHHRLQAAFFAAVAGNLNGSTIEEKYEPLEIARLYHSIQAI